LYDCQSLFKPSLLNFIFIFSLLDKYNFCLFIESKSEKNINIKLISLINSFYGLEASFIIELFQNNRLYEYVA